MSDLTDSIALAHRMTLVHQSLGRVQCTCGEWTTARGMTEGMDDVQGRHVAEVTEAQVRARVAAEIEARQIICPVHHMPDCSPLLNGCALPIHLHEQRAIDARVARGESA